MVIVSNTSKVYLEHVHIRLKYLSLEKDKVSNKAQVDFTKETLT